MFTSTSCHAYDLFPCWIRQKNLHSLYDYCMKQDINDKRCGMVLAGWLNANHEGNFRGGHPPTLLDITTSHEKVDHFIDFLFLYEDGYSNDIKKILCASIFWFYDDFMKFLSFHPDPKKNFNVTINSSNTSVLLALKLMYQKSFLNNGVVKFEQDSTKGTYLLSTFK